MVGYLENDPEHVQVLEEIDTGKCETMQETNQVEEEWVAAETSEEAIVSTGRHLRRRPERHRRVIVVVDQQLITPVMSKLIGVGWSQRIDVENENRFVVIAWLLEGVNVGDVHTGVHRRRCQVRRIEMVGHASPCLSSGARSQLPARATRVSECADRIAVTVAMPCPRCH